MGFNVEMAKKALVKVKNESVDLAINALIEIQEKENADTKV